LHPSSPFLDSNRESSGTNQLEGVSGGLLDRNGPAVQPKSIFLVHAPHGTGAGEGT
jgi:hypothetical protein